MSRPLFVAVVVAACSLAGCRTFSSRFEEDIEHFETSDRIQPPPKNAVLFVGSSSIRLWGALDRDFPGIVAINRGFGGAEIDDVNRYAKRIVLPYAPRIIVFYAGDNDIAAGKSPERVLAEFKEFVSIVRPALPSTRILFLSIKPSPSRWSLQNAMSRANALVRQYCDHTDGLEYVDVASVLLADGEPRRELYLQDDLHMNRYGYRLWAEILTPKLKQSGTPSSSR